jgi:drug/metabolite transporter (DMT)-like permease
MAHPQSHAGLNIDIHLRVDAAKLADKFLDDAGRMIFSHAKADGACDLAAFQRFPDIRLQPQYLVGKRQQAVSGAGEDEMAPATAPQNQRFRQQVFKTANVGADDGLCLVEALRGSCETLRFHHRDEALKQNRIDGAHGETCSLEMSFIENIIFSHGPATFTMTADRQRKNAVKLLDWGLLLATAVAFAVSLPFNNVLVGSFSPLLLALLRATIAFPAVWLLARSSRGYGLPADRCEWHTAILGGLLIVAVPFSAIAWGQQHISSGLGGVLYGLMPLITALFAQFLIPAERMNLRKLAGLAAGTFGLIVVIGPSTLLGLGRAPVGEAVTLVAPVSYALGIVLLRLRPAVDPLRLTAGMFLVGATMLAPWAMFEGTVAHGLRHVIHPTTGALLVGLGIAGTALPAFLNYLLVRRTGATTASLVMFFMPVIAVLLGTMLLAESLPARTVIGLAFILFGSLAITQSRRLPAGDQ